MMIKRRQNGMTLTELLVAIGLTIMMLAATAMVFNSSTQAASKARAHNEIMQQLRAVTAQLERDFAGLRPDMPMVALFDISTSFRQDRIVFFANGDFQTLDGYSGNLARVWYGQSDDSKELQLDDDYDDRFPLLRRQKLLLSLDPATIPYPDNISWESKTTEEFDDTDYENADVAFWTNKALAMMNYENDPAHSPTDIDNMRADLSKDYIGFYFTENANRSLIRRPIFTNVRDKALQKLYMLPDVKDFTVQIWLPSLGDWYPNEDNMQKIASQYGRNSFALYWNCPNLTDDNNIDKFTTIGTTQFYHNEDLMYSWPKAIKFTFTLYDGGRRYFPEGRTFNYIIKLPERK